LKRERDAGYLAELLDPRAEFFDGGLSIRRGLGGRANGRGIRIERGAERAAAAGEGFGGREGALSVPSVFLSASVIPPTHPLQAGSAS